LIDPEVLRRAYEDDPKATVASVAKRHGMSTMAVWTRLHPRPKDNTTTRRVKKSTTPEVEAAMVESFRAGNVVSRLAKDFDVTLSVVYRVLRDAGVKLRKRPPPAWRARQLAESGLTEEAI